MEKISYEPLIGHLKENGAQYNQLYLEHELRYGPVSKGQLGSWTVQVLEPIVKCAAEAKPEAVPKLFRALFSELLKLLGSQAAVVHEQEYKAAWQLCCAMPQLMQQSPLRMLQAINSALLSIRTYQPQSVMAWISLMEKSAGFCQSPEEFMICGRVNAWLCGLAHLREKVEASFSSLPPLLQQSLQQGSLPEVPLGETLRKPWLGTHLPAFKGEAGGFIGWGTGFNIPPRVALWGQYFVATDNRSSFALFADSFGKVLLPHIAVDPQEIRRTATNTALKAFEAKWGRQHIPFNDISSCAMLDNTLVLTRTSSHFLYIYGWS